MAELEELERRLEAARAQQRAIGRVLHAVARAEGLQVVLDEVVEAVTLLSGVDNGRLWLFQDGLLHAFANHGLDETFEYDRLNPHAIDPTTMAGRTALSRGLVHVPDVLEDPEYAYTGPRPYRAGLHLPILFEDPSSSATFAASHPSPRPPSRRSFWTCSAITTPRSAS